MELAQSLAPDTLKLKELYSDKYRLDDKIFKRIITMTCKFQRRISIEDCKRLTSKVMNETLMTCKHLIQLNMAKTNIIELNFLSVMTELQTLDLHKTQIRSITSMSALKNLKFLDMRYCSSLKSIDALKGNCHHLTYCDLGNTGIEDINGLCHASSLQKLYVDSTYVKDLTPIFDNKVIQYCNVGDTGVKQDSKVIAFDYSSFAKRVLDFQSRNYVWFSSILKGDVQTIYDIINDTQDINERSNAKFQQDMVRFYDTKCCAKTRLLRCDHENISMRPTGIHVALLHGEEETIKLLVSEDVDLKKTCFFEDPKFRYRKVGEVNCFEMVTLMQEEKHWITMYKEEFMKKANWQRQIQAKVLVITGALKRTKGKKLFVRGLNLLDQEAKEKEDKEQKLETKKNKFNNLESKESIMKRKEDKENAEREKKEKEEKRVAEFRKEQERIQNETEVTTIHFDTTGAMETVIRVDQKDGTEYKMDLDDEESYQSLESLTKIQNDKIKKKHEEEAKLQREEEDASSDDSGVIDDEIDDGYTLGDDSLETLESDFH